jgi:hypothetical protein
MTYAHSHEAVHIAMSTAMIYAHSYKAVTTYIAFLESDESPTSTLPPDSVHLQVRKLLY